MSKYREFVDKYAPNKEKIMAMDIPIVRNDDNDNWRFLRDYQQRQVNAGRVALQMIGKRSLLFVIPTGGGKTFTACYLIDQAQQKQQNTLVLVHRKELVRQFSESLTSYGVEHGIIAQGHRLDFTKKVQVASVGKVKGMLEKMHWRPNLIIPDEAHHCVQGSMFGAVVDHYPNAVTVGLTATPERLDGTGLGRNYGGVFDCLIQGVSVTDLMDHGNLCRYRLIGSDHIPDMTGVGRVGGDYNRKQAAERIDKPVITGNAVEHYRKYAHNKKAIVFCMNRAHAEHVAERFCEAGYKFVVIDGTGRGKDKDSEGLDHVDRSVKRLDSGEIHGLVSVDLVSEGFDLPSLEVAILLRKTQSLSLYLQQVGRALRPAPGKDQAIILDHVGNWIAHGLPDDFRDWTLEGSKGKKASKKSDAPNAFQCPKCFEVERVKGDTCSFCGHVHQVAVPSAIEEEEGELSEIDVEAVRKERKKKISKARTYEELKAVADELGYKEGWVKVQMEIRKNRGRLPAKAK